MACEKQDVWSFWELVNSLQTYPGPLLMDRLDYLELFWKQNR